MKKIILLCLLVIGLLLVGCTTEGPVGEDGDLETPPTIEEEFTEEQQADLVMAGASEESGAIAGQAVLSSYTNCKESGDNVIYDASWKSGNVFPKVSCSAVNNKVYLRSCTNEGYLKIDYIYNCDCNNVNACLSGTAPTVIACNENTNGVMLNYNDGSTEEKSNFCSSSNVQKYVCDESASLKYKLQLKYCDGSKVCSKGICVEPVPLVKLASSQEIIISPNQFMVYGGYIKIDGVSVSGVCPTTWCEKDTETKYTLSSELSAGDHKIQVWSNQNGWGWKTFEVEVLAVVDCTDSDSNIENYEFVKGETKGYSEPGIFVEHTDYCGTLVNNQIVEVESCNGNNCFVKEAGCMAGSPSYYGGATIIDCANGCGNGACNEECVIQDNSYCNGIFYTKNITSNCPEENVYYPSVDCPGYFGGSQFDATCFVPPNDAVDSWKIDCQICGKKICVNSEGKKKVSFAECSDLEPYGGWTDTGEVISGDGCPSNSPSSSGGSGGGGSSE